MKELSNLTNKEILIEFYSQLYDVQRVYQWEENFIEETGGNPDDEELIWHRTAKEVYQLIELSKAYIAKLIKNPVERERFYEENGGK